MAPKKKGGGKKKKKDDGAEPPHDGSWERVRVHRWPRGHVWARRLPCTSPPPDCFLAPFRFCNRTRQAVESGTWEKPVTDLPDANTWPTWGALRERVLTACREVRGSGICGAAQVLLFSLLDT